MNKPQSIDDYLNAIPAEYAEELQKIRSLVIQIVPSVEETMSYNMPTLLYKGRPLVYFTASKKHMSFYPSSWAIEDYRDALQEYKTTTHAIQFTLKEPLPESLMKDLVLKHKEYIDAGRK